MLRIVLVSSFVCAFFLSQGYAGRGMGGSDFEVQGTTRKRPLENYVNNILPTHQQEEDKENKKPNLLQDEGTDFNSPKKQKIETFSTPSKKYLYPIRVGFLQLKHEKAEITSPMARRIYKENDQGDYYTRRVNINGRIILQADHLFEPNALVLNKSGLWETNLERMKNGFAPIGHNGIVSQADPQVLSLKQILKKQKKFAIQLHHTTHRDSVPGEDPGRNPICEMTNAAHMSSEDRMLFKWNEDAKKITILQANLNKEASKNLCTENLSIGRNQLHWRKRKEGRSLVNRAEFNVFRQAYWKQRAETIKEGIYVPKENSETKVLIFESPVKSKEH